MLSSYPLLAIAGIVGGASAAAIGGRSTCTAAIRLAATEQVIYAYNLPDPGDSATAFESVPWGSPDAAGACLTTILANGAPAVPVALTGTQTYDFAVASRQVFSHLTGEFIDFPSNGTTLINTNITIGVRSGVPVPVTFTGHVFMDYDENCRIYAARAYAQVPTEVLGLVLDPPGL